MTTFCDRFSEFLVSYFYKWILPILSSVALLIWAKVSPMASIVIVVLWFFLMVAYLSMPWNYENPKREVVEGFLLNPRLFAIFVPLQGLVLGLGVGGITFLLCQWFTPPLRSWSLPIAALNGFLYAVTIWFESTLLRNRFGRS